MAINASCVEHIYTETSCVHNNNSRNKPPTVSNSLEHTFGVTYQGRMTENRRVREASLELPQSSFEPHQRTAPRSEDDCERRFSTALHRNLGT